MLTGWLARVESSPTEKRIVFTNEMIPKVQNRAYRAHNEKYSPVLAGVDVHGAMRNQEERILILMTGFLRGDTKTIQEQALLISKAISQAINDYPPATDQESAQWKLMSTVSEQAQRMSEAASHADFKQS